MEIRILEIRTITALRVLSYRLNLSLEKRIELRKADEERNTHIKCDLEPTILISSHIFIFLYWYQIMTYMT